MCDPLCRSVDRRVRVWGARLRLQVAEWPEVDRHLAKVLRSARRVPPDRDVHGLHESLVPNDTRKDPVLCVGPPTSSRLVPGFRDRDLHAVRRGNFRARSVAYLVRP
jgi:hypothetical protein